MSAVGSLRVERFSDPSYLAHVHAGEAVPASGWALRSDGAVFFDGVRVGRSGKYMLSRDRATPYAEISYEELDA